MANYSVKPGQTIYTIDADGLNTYTVQKVYAQGYDIKKPNRCVAYATGSNLPLQLWLADVYSAKQLKTMGLVA
jgi:hypothetical protein